MDIAALSVAMSQTRFQQDLGISVMKMAMDQASSQGNALAELMEDASAAVDPNLGANVDISI
ncbi:YjfB family protein [Anaerosinus massiliensis]|uniref:YjfB family protein n=1 Tax=Massilibacillus massiliensis TaxID=1806837 RepID=UPI000B027412|nr:YjfB family protein [Massilibacillus massiliensis]